MSVSSGNGSQWCIQNKQGYSVILDIVKIQVLIFKNNKYIDFFLSLNMRKWLVFLIIPREKHSSVVLTREDFHESVLDLRIYVWMKITATKSPLSFVRPQAY